MGEFTIQERRKAVTMVSLLLLVLSAILQGFTVAEAAGKDIKLGSVDVKHVLVDRAGEEIEELLVEERAIDGKAVGESYEVTPNEELLEDFTLYKTPENASGEITEENVVTFQYINPDAIDGLEGVVVTKYVDITGLEIAERTYTSGIVGASYETLEKEIEGFTLTDTLGEASGAYENGSTNVSYIYTLNGEDVTDSNLYGVASISYEDTEGNAVASNQVIHGEIDTPLDVEPKDIDGFTFKESVGLEVNTNFTEKDQEITFIYEATAETDAPVLSEITVHHVVVDEETLEDLGPIFTDKEDVLDLEDLTLETVAKTERFVREIGTSFSLDAQSINGFDSEHDAYFVVHQEDVENIVYVYEVAAETGYVEVFYEDAEGNTLADSIVLTGEAGEAYITIPADITGYDLSLIENAEPSGVFTANGLNVTYVYEKVDVVEEDSDEIADIELPVAEEDAPADAEEADSEETEPSDTESTEPSDDEPIDDSLEESPTDSDEEETEPAEEEGSDEDTPGNEENPEESVEDPLGDDVPIDDSMEEEVPVETDPLDETDETVPVIPDDEEIEVEDPVDFTPEEDVVDPALEEMNDVAERNEAEDAVRDETPSNTIDVGTGEDIEVEVIIPSDDAGNEQENDTTVDDSSEVDSDEDGTEIDGEVSDEEDEDGEVEAAESDDDLTIAELPQAGTSTSYPMIALGLLFLGLSGLVVLRRKGFIV